MQDISGRIEGGHFDYVRARQGGLDALFMAVYVAPEYEEKGGAKAYADGTIDMIEGFARQWPDKFVLVDLEPTGSRPTFGSGRVSILLAIENGSALEDDLDNVQHFYDRGVRYITLVALEEQPHLRFVFRRRAEVARPESLRQGADRPDESRRDDDRRVARLR